MRMLKNLENVEKMVKQKFHYNGKFKIGIKPSSIDIIFQDNFNLINPAEFFEQIKKEYKEIISLKIQFVKNNQIILTFDFENISKKVPKDLFKESTFVEDPIELAIIEQKRKAEFENSKQKFIKKIKSEGNTRGKAGITPALLEQAELLEYTE